MLGEFRQAEDLMFQSISLKEKLAKQSPLWSSLGIGYYNLGDIYIKQNNLADAERYFELSEDIFEASDHQIGLGSIHLARGEIAKARTDFETARKEWILAREIFSSNGLDLYAQKAVKKLSTLNAQLN